MEELSCGGGHVARHAQAKFRLSVGESTLRRIISKEEQA
jgi:hypothetical protein